MNNIEVKCSIEVCISGTTYKLTKYDAERLHTQLSAALNLTAEKTLNYPEGVRSTDFNAEVKKYYANL